MKIFGGCVNFRGKRYGALGDPTPETTAASTLLCPLSQPQLLSTNPSSSTTSLSLALYPLSFRYWTLDILHHPYSAFHSIALPGPVREKTSNQKTPHHSAGWTTKAKATQSPTTFALLATKLDSKLLRGVWRTRNRAQHIHHPSENIRSVCEEAR